MLVDSCYLVILMSVKNVFVILKRKSVISLLEIGLKSISDISLNLAYDILHVLNLKLELGHVDVEFFQIIGNILDLLLNIVFFMIKLYVVVLTNITHQALYGSLIFVHLFSQSIFLIKVHVPHLVKCVIVHLE